MGWRRRSSSACLLGGLQFEPTRGEMQMSVCATSDHPATFFGVIDQNAGRSNPKTGLDWFNFFWEAYSRSPKDKLIEFMANDPDVERLKAMTQEDLAVEYCTRSANSILQCQMSEVGTTSASKRHESH